MQTSPKRKLFIQTFGCQMNVYDSRKMEELLQTDYQATTNPKEADLILLNTCAIREKAENKVYSLLGKLGQLKEYNPKLKIGVGGCVAQQLGRKIRQKAPTVDMIFGTDALFDLPKLLQKTEEQKFVVETKWKYQKKKVHNFVPSLPPVEENTAPELKGYVSITKGCNNFCTFCVVPYTRGREVSRELNNVVEEAQALGLAGRKEILLLGQNVNSYKTPEGDFPELLRQIDALPQIKRLRYISPHPKDFQLELAQAHAQLPKLCEQVHLPLQAGSDKILKAMNRRHTVEEYLEKITLARQWVPDMAFSTDIIVGFPGETEEDFLGTLEVVEKVHFMHMYAFKFSPRLNTPAARYKEQVSEKVKDERLQRLLELFYSQREKEFSKLLHTKQEVMLEAPSVKDPKSMQGRTRGNIPVTVLDCEKPTGSIFQVEIMSSRSHSLVAKSLEG